MSKVIFDEESHTYTNFAGENVPSVTTILKDVGLYDLWSDKDSEWYMDRGSKVHKACHLSDMDTLDEDTLDDEIKPRLDAWKAFKKDYEVEVLQSEFQIYDEKYKYAGTVDKRVELTWKRLRRKALIDLKCGATIPGYRYQITAYDNGFDPARINQDLLLLVQLKEDGTYKVEAVDGKKYLNAFLSAVNVYHAKRRN